MSKEDSALQWCFKYNRIMVGNTTSGTIYKCIQTKFFRQMTKAHQSYIAPNHALSGNYIVNFSVELHLALYVDNHESYQSHRPYDNSPVGPTGTSENTLGPGSARFEHSVVDVARIFDIKDLTIQCL